MADIGNGGGAPTTRITGITPVTGSGLWKLEIDDQDDSATFSVMSHRVAALVAVERVNDDGKAEPEVVPLVVADLSFGETTAALLKPTRDPNSAIIHVGDGDSLRDLVGEHARAEAGKRWAAIRNHLWTVEVNGSEEGPVIGPIATHGHETYFCEACGDERRKAEAEAGAQQ